VSTPSTPATPYSVENFVDYYLSKFSKEQVTTIWKKLGKEVAINEKVQTLRSVCLNSVGMSYLQQVFIKTLFQTFSKVPVVFWLKATLIFSSV
jgi:hypothetical protein